MSKIAKKTTRQQLAAIIVQKLLEHDINAVLVGGSVVSIYTNNKYESIDLDFISAADHNRIKQAMSELGFDLSGKDYVHPNTEFTVEFPTGPIGIGDDQPINPEGKMEINGVTILMLSPTQSVMDRLAWFFYANDRQCLDQAIWITEEQPVNIAQIKAWAKREKQEEKLKVYLNRIKQ
jgi:hypothetical protein